MITAAATTSTVTADTITAAAVAVRDISISLKFFHLIILLIRLSLFINA
jgi:hypothetical protein